MPAKQKRIKGESQGVPLTVWVSETTKASIEREAGKNYTKPSSLVRKTLEAKFGA
jgi:hypothetical protein